MASPFPGMDPFLEASTIWEDFHASLAAEIRDQLTPHLRPKYYAALTPRLTYEEVTIEETKIVKPDLGVLKVRESPTRAGAAAIAPAPLVGRVALEAPLKEQSIQIHEVTSGVLVTVIEILSQVNKRPGHEAFEAYRRKRRDLLRSHLHLMEIDLLRGGVRPPLETPLPNAPYFVFLGRGDQRPRVEIWPLGLREPIPLLPVPLSAPDPDVPLDLGGAIHAVYDRAGYELRIDYGGAPPKPDLTPEERAWLRSSRPGRPG